MMMKFIGVPVLSINMEFKNLRNCDCNLKNFSNHGCLSRLVAYLFVSFSVYLFVCLHVCLYIYFFYLSVYLFFIYLSVYTFLSNCLSTGLSIYFYLFVCVHVCLCGFYFICLSVFICLFVCL